MRDVVLIYILLCTPTRLTRDPNLEANRAPGETELATLRILITQNKTTMNGSNLQLEKGEKLLATIRRRYDEQRSTLDCTLSELQVTNQYVETLKNQKATVQAEWKLLTGLAHPIHRSNADVLQYIFKWAVDLDDSQLKCATRISQVCKRWRNITLQTPILWARVDINTRRNPADIKLFWERTISRIAKIPPTVLLTLTGSQSDKEALSSFGFRGISHIRRLYIELNTKTSARYLANLRLGPLSLDQLALNVDLHAADDNPDLTSTLLSFIRKFQNLASLDICGSVLSTLANVPHSPFPRIKTLKITLARERDSMLLRTLVRLFPNVKTLELVGSSFTLDDSHDPLWTTLRYLTVRDVVIMPWRHMRLPNITGLSVIDFRQGNMEGLVSFLSGHSSLRHLTLLDWEEEISELLDVVPSLETLTVDYEYLADTPGIRLCNVEDLRVRVSDEELLTSSLLEEIVQDLLDHTTSDANRSGTEQSFAMLRILVPWPTKVDDLEWFNSDQVPAKLENVTEIEVRDTIYTSYNLRLVSQ